LNYQEKRGEKYPSYGVELDKRKGKKQPGGKENTPRKKE